MEFWYETGDSGWIKLADVASVDEGCRLWCSFAGFTVDMNLSGIFQIRQEGEVVYEGSYVTDEC